MAYKQPYKQRFPLSLQISPQPSRRTHCITDVPVEVPLSKTLNPVHSTAQTDNVSAMLEADSAHCKSGSNTHTHTHTHTHRRVELDSEGHMTLTFTHRSCLCECMFVLYYHHYKVSNFQCTQRAYFYQILSTTLFNSMLVSSSSLPR